MPDLSMIVPRSDFDLSGSKRGSEGVQNMTLFNFLGKNRFELVVIRGLAVETGSGGNRGG